MRQTVLSRVLLTTMLVLTCLWGTAHAVEGGKSLYLLGKRGPLAGLIPQAGWYITNDVYYYSGDTDQELPIAGVLSQNVSADAVASLIQLTGITETFLGSGRLAVSALVPYSHVEVSADASTSYQDNNLNIATSDQVTAFGDPVLGASLGWRHRDGDLFRAWNFYGSVFIPIGSNQEGRIANVGSNRWGFDLGTGFTLGNFKKGREFSGVLGMTINGENKDTGYESGLEAHLELAYKQHLASGLSAGIVGYYNQQLTADSGGPAVLGDFKGRVAGLGPEIAYQFTTAGYSMGLELRWYHEFNAKNRVEGDGIFMTLSIPLQKSTQ